MRNAVARHLEIELGDRGLLLAADDLVAAEAEAARRGARLLACVMHRCYPISRQARALAFEFEGHAARLAAALAFGAVTAWVLVPTRRDSEPAGLVELLCAMFNLGIGLVDGLCDEDHETGGALLELVHLQDLVEAAEEPRPRGWLGAALPPALAEDHTVAFAVAIIETFFETLHGAYPGDAWLQQRRGIGIQLQAALEAERRSVVRPVDHRFALEELIECSRVTSVIPFQIIHSLADANYAAYDPSVATLLGEAMWRIDDLVDLCQDARSGALNSILLAATETPGHAGGERDVVAALKGLLASTDIARATAQAAENLLAGLHSADHQSKLSFLHFIQRYTGIAPRHTS